MLKNLLFGFVLLSVVFSHAQESNWSVEANFPYTFGDNFVDEGYNGALDVGLDYRFSENDVMDLGASMNVGAFYRDDSRFDGGPEVNGSALLFQPRVYTSLHIESLPGLHPMVGLGYSVFVFSIDDQNFAGADFQENASRGGLNFNTAIALDVSDRIFIQLQYDYIRMSTKDVINSPYNRNVNILKLGGGYRF